MEEKQQDSQQDQQEKTDVDENSQIEEEDQKSEDFDDIEEEQENQNENLSLMQRLLRRFFSQQNNNSSSTKQETQQQKSQQELQRKNSQSQKQPQEQTQIKFSNQYYEFMIDKKIYNNQIQYFNDLHRKLKQLPAKKLFQKYQLYNSQLNIPPTYDYFAKITANMLPNKRKYVDNIDQSVYNTLFNEDGSKLLITTQESLHIYNNENGQFKRWKVLNPQAITWTITDSDLTRCGRYLIHCSLNPFISLFDCKQGVYKSLYNLSQGESDEDYDDYYQSSLRFFSCKFSGDESKIIASSGVKRNRKSYIKLFDLEKNRLQESIAAHTDDINSICFIDRTKSNVFVSGSDDRLLKIWDTRALGSQGKHAGVLIGHVGGVTNVVSRQDNYYVASNSKDQSLKLWDLRKSDQDYAGKPRKNYNYDYRYGPLSKEKINEIANLSQSQNYDNSVHTFRGHIIARTLMRCHFSPQSLTESRFVYTASACGRIFIYDIYNPQNIAQVLNDKQQSIIRDAIWHPNQMEIYTSNLSGDIFKWYNNKLQFHEKDDEEDNDNLNNIRRRQSSRFQYFQELEENESDQEYYN